MENLQRKIRINVDVIRAHIKSASGLFESPPSRIGVALVSRREIRKLNRRFLKKNADTDVMSFRISRNCGEVVISPETAAENAGRYGHTTESEILYLIIHGYLHLKNYRDYTAREREIMFGIQDSMFRKMMKNYGGARR